LGQPKLTKPTLGGVVRGPAGAKISEIDMPALSPQIGPGVDQLFNPMAANICSVCRLM